ncbi:MAG: thiosulfate oxidation carrier protein SoxY [Methylococcaceae bacterium]|nr:thiosulfate oxidation carrier protein SoxY [Methylococcaceae bacterium]
MPCTRRTFLQHALTVMAYSYGLFARPSAHAAPDIAKPAFSLLEQTLKELFNGSKIIETDKIDIQVPMIAENGAVVPITVSSSLNNVRKVYILVEKNPQPLSARFALAPELETIVSARLKMAETSDVIVVAETHDGLYSAKAGVKVTIGGCGG